MLTISLQLYFQTNSFCRCKDKTYRKYTQKVSVVMNYHNELLSLLLRSIYSIISSIPRDNFHELILVDDASNLTVFCKLLTSMVYLFYIKSLCENNLRVINTSEL